MTALRAIAMAIAMAHRAWARVVRWLVTGWVRPGWLVPLQGAAMVGHLLPGGPGVRLPLPVRSAGAVGLLTGAERMLTHRFGAEYEEYRARVPRILGLLSR